MKIPADRQALTRLTQTFIVLLLHSGLTPVRAKELAATLKVPESTAARYIQQCRDLVASHGMEKAHALLLEALERAFPGDASIVANATRLPET